jgi:hypothetical protein
LRNAQWWPLFFSLAHDDALARIGEVPQQLEVEEDVWSKFDEGWKRKGGVEVGEKRWRSGQPPMVDRSTDDQNQKVKGREEERKGKGKCFGGCFGM